MVTSWHWRSFASHSRSFALAESTTATIIAATFQLSRHVTLEEKNYLSVFVAGDDLPMDFNAPKEVARKLDTKFLREKKGADCEIGGMECGAAGIAAEAGLPKV